MIITTTIAALLIYLLIGYLLSIAFQEEGQHSFSVVLSYPLIIAFFCALTIVLLISDVFTDSELEYTTQ